MLLVVICPVYSTQQKFLTLFTAGHKKKFFLYKSEILNKEAQKTSKGWSSDVGRGQEAHNFFP